MNRLLGGIFALGLIGGMAFAQPANVAEDEFNKGNTAYNLGKWDEAIAHFTTAYEASPIPDFLYNIAQSHRQAGNCKQALHFYKRFKSIKENDKAAPLTAKKKADIDKFIKQLTECAAKQDDSASAKPDALAEPPVKSTSTSTQTTPPPPTPTQTTTPVISSTPPVATTKPSIASAPAPAVTANPAIATADSSGDGAEDEQDTSVTKATATVAPKLVSVRAVSGIALLSSGDLVMPVQPSFALSAGYPLAVGPIELDLGAGVSYVPLPYEVMGAQKRGMMLGGRAVIGAAYPVAPKFVVRGELGGGVVALSGLEMGNPIVGDRSAKSFTLPNIRIGVAADYLITPNIAATIAPFAFAYSPANDALYGGSLREIDVLVGIGYRQ